MTSYEKTSDDIWKGRTSDKELYLHEKVQCIDLEKEELTRNQNIGFSILGYECEEGVKRNQGRIGTVAAPDIIRKMMGSLSNHFKNDVDIIDIGNVNCVDDDLEKTQSFTSNKIKQSLEKEYFNIVLGGGHDLGYAHYNGLKKHLPKATIGIINLDAHFDLRVPNKKGNSGTPFYQIANENDHFKYLCLGIQEEANNRILFETARELGVNFIKNTEFTMSHIDHIDKTLTNFINTVDYVYLSIDLDGFSSAYAPGVSAPSPFGFSPSIALHTIEKICNSKKLISADIVELNPAYDVDNCTARLAARLIYYIMKYISTL
ncbi:formimidoylglutamase [uncultured Aquimarina sp.]|uniref:formimidoylglutamase n=1 Tax=uncultured Aquimarina sp. TaxID=575652 RepID=UPI002627D7EE|nr:formimidoylglutamase [uncultured Aquimarina sp.]